MSADIGTTDSAKAKPCFDVDGPLHLARISTDVGRDEYVERLVGLDRDVTTTYKKLWDDLVEHGELHGPESDTAEERYLEECLVAVNNCEPKPVDRDPKALAKRLKSATSPDAARDAFTAYEKMCRRCSEWNDCGWGWRIIQLGIWRDEGDSRTGKSGAI
jgi:hypothetical protein